MYYFWQFWIKWRRKTKELSKLSYTYSSNFHWKGCCRHFVTIWNRNCQDICRISFFAIVLQRIFEMSVNGHCLLLSTPSRNSSPWKVRHSFVAIYDGNIYKIIVNYFYIIIIKKCLFFIFFYLYTSSLLLFFSVNRLSKDQSLILAKTW